MIAEMILPELDHEMANTRKHLALVPEDQLDWQPHSKSMTLGRLAGHLVEIPLWAESTFAMDALDFAPPGGKPYEGTMFTTRDAMLALFDANVARAKTAVAGASDADFGKPWSLLQGGHVLFTMPKGAVLRSFVLSHAIHHRAQLGVYLRLLGQPVPGVYGPSADDKG